MNIPNLETYGAEPEFSPAPPDQISDGGGLVATPNTPDLGNENNGNDPKERDTSVSPLVLLAGLGLLFFIFKSKK
jgi:hypothetical protein